MLIGCKGRCVYFTRLSRADSSVKVGLYMLTGVDVVLLGDRATRFLSRWIRGSEG